MCQEISRPSAETGRAVERGETYRHEEYGAIEVTGIWRGTCSTDGVSTASNEQAVAIRYAPDDDRRRTDEFADTLADFLTAVA